MPWANPEVPSIQIAALKNYLSDQGVQAEAGHWYVEIALAIGFDAYARISTPEVSAAEPFYSYLCFPEMRGFLMENEAVLKRARTIEKSLRNSTDDAKIKFRWDDVFFREFEALHSEILDRYDWGDYALVGFTLNYGQTVASLYMAREIKKRNPNCQIIVGGAEASGELGKSLVENFPEFDYACNGEGELPLLELSRALVVRSPELEIRKIKGLIGRGDDGAVYVNPPQQIESLDELSPPDFDEYFEAIRQLGHDPQGIIRELPIEASRGCPFACNFCSLNLQWENFRSRSPEKVSEDIRELSQKYKVVGFRFMDNILPKSSEKIFSLIADQEMDYRFFYEIRAQTPPRILRLMKKAGATMIQCGVEALSTSLLKKFNKKSRFINNLQAMKLCEELDIQAANNIITDFPFATAEEVEETARNMEYCLAYQPAQISSYTLGVGSPDYDNREARGLGKIRNADVYRYIYPPELFDRLNLIAKSYRFAGKRARWNPVTQALNRWKKAYVEGKKKLPNGQRNLLCYSDGGNFLQIEDRRGRTDGGSVLHVLDGFQREVYLFADEIRPLNAIQERFPGDEDKLKSLLQYFLENKLMYEEDGHYLSLAMSGSPEKRLLARDSGSLSLQSPKAIAV